MSGSFEIDPRNVQFLVKLAQLYRKSGQAVKGEQLFRNSLERVLADGAFQQQRRSYFYEWSAAAGNAGDQALAIWFAGVSLSDWQDLPRLDAETAKRVLAGLGAACRELFAERSEQMFLKARGAAGQLGLRIENLDPTAKKHLEHHRDDARAAGVQDMSVEQAVRAIEGVVQRAYELCQDADELVELGVPYPPDEFRFSSLQEFMLAERRRTRR